MTGFAHVIDATTATTRISEWMVLKNCILCWRRYRLLFYCGIIFADAGDGSWGKNEHCSIPLNTVGECTGLNLCWLGMGMASGYTKFFCTSQDQGGNQLTRVILYTHLTLFFRRAWIGWWQKGKTIVDFNEATDDGLAVASHTHTPVDL